MVSALSKCLLGTIEVCFLESDSVSVLNYLFLVALPRQGLSLAIALAFSCSLILSLYFSMLTLALCLSVSCSVFGILGFLFSTFVGTLFKLLLSDDSPSCFNNFLCNASVVFVFERNFFYFFGCVPIDLLEDLSIIIFYDRMFYFFPTVLPVFRKSPFLRFGIIFSCLQVSLKEDGLEVISESSLLSAML